MQEHLDQVTLHDLYARLGRLEEGQGETNEKIGELVTEVGKLCASLNGPSHIKERVSRLEAWRNRLLGMGIVVVILLGGAEALRWLLN